MKCPLLIVTQQTIVMTVIITVTKTSCVNIDATREEVLFVGVDLGGRLSTTQWEDYGTKQLLQSQKRQISYVSTWRGPRDSV